MEARTFQSSSLCTAFSSGSSSINRYRFSSASSAKPLSVSFLHQKRAPCVLSMSKKDDDTDSLSYKDSCVDIDIDAGAKLVIPIEKMSPDIGGFSGRIELLGDYDLVLGMDAVGTKLKFAFETGIYETVGVDLVAMSVNNIVTCGAKPLNFLDYNNGTNLEVDLAEKVTKGIVDGCKQAGCKYGLFEGEITEISGFYAKGEYNLVGCAVGLVKKNSVIDGKEIVAGDVLIGLPSSGLHSDGYSLFRSFMARSGLSLEDKLPGGSTSLGEAIMAPTIIYVEQVLDFISKGGVKGLAHITGGGFTDNIPRVLPDGLGVVIHTDAWELPPLFKLIKECKLIADTEMRRTFNMGIGMVMVVSPEAALRILEEAENGDYVAYRIGQVINGEGVTYL